MSSTGYIFGNAVKNLWRNRTRYIVCGLFLLCTVSVLACTLYYSVNMERYILEMEEKYMSQINFKFREDLQWLGDEYNHSEVEVWGMPPVIFNSDGSMDKYNVPIYVTMDFYEQFADSRYAVECILAYTENVYGVFNIETDDTSEKRAQMRNTNFMYGGTFDAFKFMFSGVNESGKQMTITEGREHGAGECLIYEDTAKQCGYKIGDYITYNDATGTPLGQLRISGLFVMTVWGEKIQDEFDSLRIYGTNPFFRNNHTYTRYTVITDFDTVYNLYGYDEGSDEFRKQHEINKYLAWYVLDNYRNFDAFVEECGQYGYSDIMGFHPDVKRYEAIIETPAQLINVANWVTGIMGALSALILILTTSYMLRERRYEIGISFALGASKTKITLMFLYESILLMIMIALISVGTGLILANLFEQGDKAIRELSIRYYPTFGFLVWLTGISVGVSVIATAVSSVYILRNSPSELISSRR